MPRPPGHTTLLAIATSAYSSYSSCRQYREDFARVLEATQLLGTVTIDKVRQFFDHPGFVHAFTEGVTAAVRELIGDGVAPERIRVLFSTHSIPTSDAQRSGPRDRDFGEGGAYAAQHEAVAGVVMSKVVEAVPEAAETGWELVYQSRSGPPTQPWLEPDVCDVIGELPARGVEAVVIVPLGFVSDHMEVHVGSRHRGDGGSAGGRHPGRAHADARRGSRVRQRSGRPGGRAPRGHARGRAAARDRPRTVVRRVSSRVLRERPRGLQARGVGSRPVTGLFKPGAPIRVGTRASALAVAQTSAIAAELGAHELVTITSEGDRSSAPLASMGGTGVFVSALRDALLAGEVDLIVHSFKDLPTAPADGIRLAAVPPRADARDALATRDGVTLAKLPAGARVGTGSPRRRAQLLAARPDLDVVGIRGNVDTRLGRLFDADDDRRVDGLVLAAAGLERLGRLDEASELLDLDAWPTAPAQGALALEIRDDAPAALAERVAAVDHVPTRLAATAERGVLARLEAGCSAPIAAHASVEGGMLTLTAVVFAADGQSRLTVVETGPAVDEQSGARRSPTASRSRCSIAAPRASRP